MSPNVFLLQREERPRELRKIAAIGVLADRGIDRVETVPTTA
jgi:hypothetical protein